jgi:hypothetical protein
MAPMAMQNSVAAMSPGASLAEAAALRGCTVLLAGAALLICSSVRAAEVTFVPRASLMGTWTDNVGLDPSGEEESDWITELRPGFSLGAEGSRASAQFDYDLQALWYADRSERNDVYHQARGDGNVVVVPESLFIDGFARYDQRTIDPAGRVDFGNLFDTDNRTDVLVFGASPYHVGRWGNWAESLVRYDYREVRNFNTDETSTNVQDSDGQTITAELNSPEGASGFTWGTTGLYTRTEFDDDNDPGQESEFEYAQAAVNLGVPVSLKTRLTGTLGRETDVSEDSTKGGLDTDFWYVGFAWNPDLLQSLEARVGERYFGRSWGGRYTRRAARGSVELDYSENPTTSAGVLSDGAGLPPGVRPGRSMRCPSTWRTTSTSRRCRRRSAREDWDSMNARVDQSTRRLLEVFEEAGTRATFFVLGWVAERHPELVREIHRRGHEVACHGYSHRMVYQQSPRSFARRPCAPRHCSRTSRRAGRRATGPPATPSRPSRAGRWISSSRPGSVRLQHLPGAARPVRHAGRAALSRMS